MSDIEFLNISQMLNYAAQIYPRVRNLIIEDTTYAYNAKRQIARTLTNHHLAFMQEGAYAISKPIAECVIEHIMFDYFTSKIPETAEEAGAKISKRKNAEIEKRSKKMDAELNNSMKKKYQDDYESDILGIFEETNPDNHFGNEIYKGGYQYEIPQNELSEDEIDSIDFKSFFDKVVDRMMLRALFSKFYDFDEEKYRRDLAKRSTLINSAEQSYRIGFSELSRMLENPIGTYVIPKKQKNEKALKKREIEDIYLDAANKVINLLAEQKAFNINEDELASLHEFFEENMKKEPSLNKEQKSDDKDKV